MEALFTVRYEGKSHQVEVSYNPGKSVAGVKELIVAKLKDAIAGPRELSQMEVRVEDLTLKTLDGVMIASDEMPLGKKFLADLDESLVVKHSKGNQSFIKLQTHNLVTCSFCHT